MANIKFSGFTLVTDVSGIQEIVGYNGTQNVRITPANFVTTGGTGIFLPLAGGTMGGNILYGDNIKSLYGASSDFEIYHDATTNQNKITSNLGRQLLVNADSFVVNNGADSANLIIAENSGTVKLYYSGSKKFETTSTGVSVDGEISLTSGATAIGSIRNEAGALDIRGDSTRDVSLGSVTTPQALFVEGSNGNVGIGTATPSVGLQLGNSASGETKVAIFNSEGGGEVGLSIQSRTNRAKLRVADNDSNAYVVAEAGKAFFGTSATGDATNVTVLTSGNVGIGTASPSEKLHVAGNARVTGAYYDSNNTPGTSGQVLSSTGGGTDWIDAAAGAANVTDTATGINVTSPGTQNIFVGFNAGAAGSSSNENTYVGYKAGEGATGSDNVFIGNEAGHLSSNTFSRQVAIGHEAGEIGGERSINIGYRVHGGREESVSIGYQAATGAYSVKIGSLAGQQGSGTETGTVLIGYRAGYRGSQTGNIAIGYEASNRGGSDEFSTVIGYQANRNLEFDDEVFTTAVGYQAGLGVEGSTNGNNGSYFGHRAGYAILSGVQNTLIGSFAGDALTTGSNNIVIGYNAAASSVSVSNEITLGNASITAIRAAVTSITSLSDERDKKDIKDITYGLDFISKLQPREFVWDNRSEYKEFLPHSIKKENADLKEIVSANKGKKDFGFIAQEVQAHDDDTLRLIYNANPDKLEMSYGKLVPILVKAIQELSEKVTALENS